MTVDKPEAMPPGFEPPTRGRPPLVNVTPIVRKIEDGAKVYGAHRWLAFRTFDMRECRSIHRRLSNMGYEAAIATEDGKAVLYTRKGAEHG